MHRSGLNSMGAGSLQLQMLPYPSTLLQKSFLLLLSSVAAQWHSASAGRRTTSSLLDIAIKCQQACAALD
ncbi:hypothetical protein EYF80_015002 [Liparis tanakae]|uniref:Uncharacterized protein n=1 Tax=Liparis tanakae TaxID=230148 RepID=A0A4Z2IBH4_9TELE|nr:hypothetical protein EYF80_015002 [Liparis tanakae]